MMTLKLVELFGPTTADSTWFGNKKAEMSWQRKRRQHNRNVLAEKNGYSR